MTADSGVPGTGRFVTAVTERLSSATARRLLWRVLSFSLVFGAWEVAGRIPISLAFPPFTATAYAFVAMIFDGTLIAAFADTLQPLAIGILFSGALGVVFGIGMGLFRTIEWFTLPIFIILQSAPVAAIIPLITFIYGIGLAAKIFAVVIMAAPLIVLNSYKGIRNTNPSLLQMSRSFLGTRRQEIVKIILPAASALIFAGLRLGLAAGFIGVVLAELLITPTGIGDLITYYRAVAEYPRMFASIAAIIAFAAFTVTFMQKLEAVLFRPETRGS